MRATLWLTTTTAAVMAVVGVAADRQTKKDIRDYNDVDIERLYDQWTSADERDDDDAGPDGRPRRPSVRVDAESLSDPEALLRASKRGVTLMSFVTVSGRPTRAETETLSSLWQTSLRNAHVIAERYVIADDRLIFMFADGSQAWAAKDYLVEQSRVQDVTIDGKVYGGRHREL